MWNAPLETGNNGFENQHWKRWSVAIIYFNKEILQVKGRRKKERINEKGKASDLVYHNLGQLCQSSQFGPAISQVLLEKSKSLLLDIICIPLLLKNPQTKLGPHHMRLCTNKQYFNTFTSPRQFTTCSCKTGLPWPVKDSSTGQSIWYKEHRSQWKSFPSFCVLWLTLFLKKISCSSVLKPPSHLTLLCGIVLQHRWLWAKGTDLFYALVQQNADCGSLVLTAAFHSARANNFHFKGGKKLLVT